MAEKGYVKESDYILDTTRKNAAGVAGLTERLRIMDIVVKDLTYILNEMLAESPNPAFEGYREALEEHLATMEQGT